MSADSYYTECLAEAFCSIDKWELWKSLSEAEREELGAAIAGAAENYSTYSGMDVISDPRDDEIERLKAAHKQEIARLEGQQEVWRKAVANQARVDANSLYIQNGTVYVSRN